MLDQLGPVFAFNGANFVLYFLLPTAIAVSIGLIWIGIVRRAPSAVVFGVLLGIGVPILGFAIRAGAVSSLAANGTAVPTSATYETFLPYSIGFAVVLFLVILLPGIVRAYRH